MLKIVENGQILKDNSVTISEAKEMRIKIKNRKL